MSGNGAADLAESIGREKGVGGNPTIWRAIYFQYATRLLGEHGHFTNDGAPTSEQEERFKWAANERADRAEAEVERLRAALDVAIEPRPLHAWNDPDGDGHNCVDCPRDSMWKCDVGAHFPADPYGLLTPEDRASLDESLETDKRVRRDALHAARTLRLR